MRSNCAGYLGLVGRREFADAGLIDAPLGKDGLSRLAVKDCVRSDGLPSQTRFQVQRRISRVVSSPSLTTCDYSSFSSDRALPVFIFHPPSSKLCLPYSFHTYPPCALLPFTFLRALPVTGRKHQIHIRLAHLGHPILGDKLYGGDEDLYLARRKPAYT